MNVVCFTCGERWDIFHVLHVEPDDFDRSGAVIRRCPCCTKDRISRISESFRAELDALREVAELQGDDIDGFAAFLDTFDFLGGLEPLKPN